MASSKRSQLENLPLELKLNLLQSLNSIYDLDALSVTCTVFHNLSKDPICTSIRLRLLSRGKIGRCLKKLRTVRAYRRAGLPYDSWRMKNVNLDTTSNAELVRKPLFYRSVTKWFLDRFFATKAERYGDTSQNSGKMIFIPSRYEIERIEAAFLCIWGFSEMLNFDPHTGCGTWGMGERGPVKEFEDLMDVGVVCNVQVFLWELLAPIAQRYFESLGPEEASKVLSRTPCIGFYNRKAVPNLLLNRLGLDGVRELLMSGDETRNAIIANHYPHAVCLRRYLHNLPSIGWSGYYFEDFWDNVVDDELKELTLSRPLWKKPDAKLIIGRVPWSQGEDFEIDAVFCDDKRLEKLGYYRPEGRIESNGIKISDTPVRKIMMETCACRGREKCGY